VRVFVSHNTGDHDKAQAVEAALRARLPGHEWYLAPRNVAGGAWWVPKLAAEIANSDAVLFLAGQKIGEWQELEYYEALRLSREHAGRPLIIPVVIAEQAPGLPFFAQLHHIFAADPIERQTLGAIERALDDSLPADTTPAWRRFQPYKGLPALEEADAAFFFGRDAETAAILDRMARHPKRIVTLIGDSGVGKSSLARAGVLARLKSQLWPGVEIGSWPAGLADSRAFLPLVVRPGEQPLKELAHEIARLYTTRTFELDEEAAGWARRFADGSGLHDLLRAARDRLAEALAAEPPKRFVIYLDQGEELYTRAKPDEARRFSEVVAEAAGHESFSVLLSLRNDYYSAWQKDRALFDIAEHFDVLPPAGAILGEIIRRPAEMLKARFESSDIVERAAEATEREPGSLPLLSDLLHEMWVNMQERGDGELRWSDVPGIIDVTAPLRRRAEAFLADPANDAAVVRRLFTLRLAHVPEIGEPVRRRAQRSECGDAEWATAEKLAGPEWRLLTLAQTGDGTPVVEVAHEQLLRRWPRLKSWLDEEREFLVWKGQLERETAHREPELLTGRRLAVARGWFERRSADIVPGVRQFVSASVAAEQQRRRFALSAVSVALAGFVILSAFAGWKWYDADAQRKLAEAQRKRAEHSLALATQTANAMIFDIAQKFDNAVGVPTATIEGILNSAGKLQEQLSVSGESSPELRRSQAAAQMEISTTLLAAGDGPGALAAAGRSREIFEGLSKSAPDNTDYQRELSVSFGLVGDGLVAQGNLPEALKLFKKALAITERLAKSDPGNAVLQSDLSDSYERVGDVLRAQGDLAGALKSYQNGLAIRDALAKTDPGLPEWRRDLSVSASRVGDVLMAQGNLPEALKSYQGAHAIDERLAKSDPSNASWQRDLSVSDNKLGDVLVAQGNLPGALKSYQNGLAIRDRLAKSDPGNALWQSDLSASYERVGDVLADQGNLPGALKSYQNGLAIGDRLAKSDPGNAKWQQGLLVPYQRVGNALSAQRKLPEALKFYEADLGIAKRLAQSDPRNAEWQLDLSVCYEKVGDALLAQGNLPEALKFYQNGLAIKDRLAKSDPGNAQWQSGLSASYESVGEVLADQGNLPDALKSYRADLAIVERLASSDPRNSNWQSDLSVSYEKVGDLLLAQGNLPEALKFYQADLGISERLAKSDPSDARRQRNLSVSYEKVGKLLVAQGNMNEALKFYSADVEIAERLAKSDPGNAQWQQDLMVSYRNIGDLLISAKRSEEALVAYNEATKVGHLLMRTDRRDVQSQRLLVLVLGSIQDINVDMGNAAGALASAEEQVKLCRSIYETSPSADVKSDLVIALGSLSFALLENRRPADALGIAQEALSLDRNAAWVELYRVDALLLLGRFEEARDIYIANKDKRIDGASNFMGAVIDNFDELKRFGIDNPQMETIQTLLSH
jgi:tetratricopeptide (TPR) repeat protein